MSVDVAAVLSVAEAALDDNPYGFIATQEADSGQIALRLVRHLQHEGVQTIWIGTSPRSRKAAAVERSGRATYAVEDRTRIAYASLACHAAVVTEPPELERRWNDALGPFFPGGPHGGDFAVLRLEPYRLELMSFADRIHPPPYGLRAAAAVRTENGWVLDD